MVRNELYAGRLFGTGSAWSGTQTPADEYPDPNPRQDWHVMEVPELAIVPAELFEAAQSRIKARSDIAPTLPAQTEAPS